MGPGKYVVEVAYADDTIMRRLNQRFNNRRTTTDVLAFPCFIDGPQGLVVGEVVVNREAARRASDEGGGVMREMLRYVVHGVLHLAGFDDHNHPAALRMWKKQEEVIESIPHIRGKRKMRFSGRQSVSLKGRA
jgi:probable rRNA maturation factor